jgi:pimeloyl-ACP methyl ester carboxylesterase
MKRSLIRILVYFILITLISCSKDEKEKNYTWFVSLDQAASFNETYIGNLITTASTLYPEINDFKSLVSGGVTVNKLVYKTEVNGKKIEASGLVCFPAISGEYPVISFQNGTNTVNAYAPSNFALNTTFQMIEIIASMGYIVVIPDYPGFGESSSIPHPYLVEEPTTTSVVDMFHAVNEIDASYMPGITIKNEYYLMGYSQGGWATMALHKALETKYSDDFNLAGSACGAGPYDMTYLLKSMIGSSSYPMPVYIGYIINAYKSYNQFTNPVTDILNQPYASRLGSLYNGTLDFESINNQLTTSIPALINPDFISGFDSNARYLSVREAMSRNSIAAYATTKPLLLVHGASDTQVNPQVTEYFYNEMIRAGTSASVVKKEIFPGLDHGDGVFPAVVSGLEFLRSIAAK